MFLTVDDLKTHMYAGIRHALTQGDATIAESAIAAAVAEAQGYCSRYNVAALFGTSGVDRDPVLLLHVKNIAKWNFIALANPEIDYDDAQLRYDQAIAWLKNVQAGKTVPPNWPPAVEPTYAPDLVRISSNRKRPNHY